jgi:large subunit ribosomal protein L23
MKIAHEIIKKPIVTEKSFAESQRGRYSFVVGRDANKIAIKDAVQALYGVTVVGVFTNIIKGTKMRYTKKGRNIVNLSYKKARVQLAKDQKIDIFESQEK